MKLLGKWFGFSKDEVFDEGMAAYDRGAYEDAIEAFKACINSDTDPSETRLARFYLAQSHAELGHERMRAGDPFSAIRAYESALELYPNYPDLNLATARAYRQLGALDKQAHYVERALEVNPRYVDAILFQGITWYESDKHDEGLARVNHACQVDPALSVERYQRALECHCNGDKEQALAQLISMASYASADANLHVRVGDTFVRDGKFKDAAGEYLKALKIVPDYCEAHCRLGKTLLALGKNDEALQHLERSVQLNGGNAEAHAQLGLAYKALRRESDARRAFSEALNLHPNHPVAIEYARVPVTYAA
jgi:protein O-GlcNAc transferase